jgi:histidine phosphotransferase ChpT
MSKVAEKTLASEIVEMEASMLSSLVCARLCHDLVGPVSAIGAALDVLEDEDAADMRDDAMSLLRESANSAWARLEFTRLAFGAGGSAPGRIDAVELERVVTAMFEKSKSDIVWAGGGETLEKSSARVLLNLVLLAVEALPRGGAITIEILPDGSEHRIVCEGARARLSPAAAAALEGIEVEGGYDARSIQPYFAGLLARQAGGSVRSVATEGRVEIYATIPPPEDE